jgi:hypothetical protein
MEHVMQRRRPLPFILAQGRACSALSVGEVPGADNDKEILAPHRPKKVMAVCHIIFFAGQLPGFFWCRPRLQLATQSITILLRAIRSDQSWRANYVPESVSISLPEKQLFKSQLNSNNNSQRQPRRLRMARRSQPRLLSRRRR